MRQAGERNIERCAGGLALRIKFSENQRALVGRVRCVASSHTECKKMEKIYAHKRGRALRKPPHFSSFPPRFWLDGGLANRGLTLWSDQGVSLMVDRCDLPFKCFRIM